ANVYLWTYVHDCIRRYRKSLYLLTASLYWLPLATFYGMVITGFFYPFTQWDIPARAYITGTIVITLAIMAIPAAFLTINDIIRISRYSINFFHHRPEAKWQNFPRNSVAMNVSWILAGVMFLISVLGMSVWVFHFRVNRVTLELPELPFSFNGIRIVQISDLHLGNWTQKEKLEVAVDSINALHPDLVFMTGDMFNFTNYEGRSFENILKKIHARDGIFAVPGNHDYGDYTRWPDSKSKQENLEEIYRFYKRLGWRLLLNEHAIIHRGKDSIAVLGIHNWGLAKRFQRLGNVNIAAKGLGKMPVQLLLSHDPSYWNQIIKHSHPFIDVTFSGHTHGFQCGIVTNHIRWSPLALKKEEWAGIYSNNLTGHRQYLYVNIGLGTVTYPGRIGSFPEITLITLVK
ncbi:MAG: metallophosphoesterase, partial [Bacteroidota bacterium]|nr:metallophosphoesterase [Bacteroidota bacterium]